MKDFVTEFAALGKSFPAVRQLGFDGKRARVIDFAPPVILFGLYEVLSRMDRWEEIPAGLQDLIDEIDDPDILSDRLLSTSSFSSSSLVTLRKTPTERFCRKHPFTEKKLDPVRLNRLRYFAFEAETILGMLADMQQDDINATIAGEGTAITNPLKITLVAMKAVVELIEGALETFGRNREICRELHMATLRQ